jgi:sugar lactone lactonase YvrE
VALSADGEMLYFCALTSHELYAIPTAYLREPPTNSNDLIQHVVLLGDKHVASDGLAADNSGRLFLTSLEGSGVLFLDQARCWSPQLLWHLG